LVIAGIVLFVVLFPMIYRSFINPVEFPQRSQVESPSLETRQEWERLLEMRIWSNISRTLVVGAGIGLLMAVIFTRWITAPMKELEDGARAVADGQLAYRVPARGSQEMQAVAESFNRMAAQLERQESLRQDMLADVTHELRHPIHILQGNLQAILDDVYPLSMEEIARLSDQTQHLTTLVDDLHELAQAEARQLPLFKQETDVNLLVQNTAEAFRPLAEADGITFDVDLLTGPLLLEIDADRVRQALQNLLSNALRYTPEGGEIKVSLEALESVVSIAVEDSGIGIQPEDLARVFDRFYRSDAARSREAPGAGLGLAIARALIQAHDGQIEVYSAVVDQGSRFTIKLPIL
jgi:signal transduction histidine kinase